MSTAVEPALVFMSGKVKHIGKSSKLQGTYQKGDNDS